MWFSNSSLVIVSSAHIPLLATLETILWEALSGLQCQSSSRTFLTSYLLAFFVFSMLVRDEDLVSEAILEWCLDAQQDEKNFFPN